MTTYLVAAIVLLALSGFYAGRYKARSIRVGSRLNSLPQYHGIHVALWSGLPALILIVLWVSFESVVVEALVRASLSAEFRTLSEDQVILAMMEIRNLAQGIGGVQTNLPFAEDAASMLTRLSRIADYALVASVAVVAILGLGLARSHITLDFQARQSVERIFNVFIFLSSAVAVMTTVAIVLSLLFESFQFFKQVPVHEFLFGLKWNPQIAIRADQGASTGAFGAVPVFSGTLLIALVAMLVAGPIGLASAVYFSEYARPRVRDLAKPILELLAGIPTVVYGFFAALTVAPLVRELGLELGLEVEARSALAAGVVMGIMIIPFISSLADDVITAVPQSLREGSYAMGATQSETIKYVIFPAALPGIVGAFLLAISRAIGETMIVAMAAGLNANLTANPLENVTTVTVQIVVALIGDQEFDDPKTLSAFALGLVLFAMTLILNVVALMIVKRYREQYE
ncbi:MAG TPA: phosphate ABC transporter permease subunit PstC [Gammaproteobacteria bacterium]|jgi:phosphate transport system permease protein|nr:phosphate ABC transporter permease subunit PstC [Gammaproteobacteria bacterium]HBP84899.1 phosphate ABC transporter permease subunit PstC [Gammaproteobacteria bacterium]HCL94980.1 phosphate ABC transporter permease subunit PstC [Gammaproteobacteria bacterium]|tara:strand:- start:2611 stop:3984 length:1374 start_codon:yes stop_codon:yes gene_type:complete